MKHLKYPFNIMEEEKDGKIIYVLFTEDSGVVKKAVDGTTEENKLVMESWLEDPNYAEED